VFQTAVTVPPAATAAVIGPYMGVSCIQQQGDMLRTGGSLEFPIEQVISPELGLLTKPLSALVARTMRRG
jgi:hypothetical protein